MTGGDWTRRSVASASRLEEMVALYRALGFEVRLEPLDPRELRSGCASCAPDLVDCRAVYTRPASRLPAGPGAARGGTP